MNVINIIFKLGLGLFLFLIFTNALLAQSTKITISEINYKSDKSRDSEDWIELLNYGSQSADISNWILQGEKFNEFYIIPNGTVIGANKRKVFCRDELKFQQIYPSVDFIGPFVFRLSGKGQPIRIYDNDNILYLEMFYQDTVPFPKTPDGHGRTLELTDPEGDLNDGNNWFAGCILGSPGSSYKECYKELVFSEVNNSSTIPIAAGDWVEIRNISDEVVNVSNWTFKNRKDTVINEFKIPEATVIQPGEHLVLARKNKFTDFYPNVPNVVKPFEFGIRSNQEVLKLYDENGKIYTSMFYDNQSPWPVNAGTNTITLELLDSSISLCSPYNWFDGCPGGTPGTYYSSDCIYSSVNDIMMTESQSKAFPNPFSTITNIEVKTNSDIGENLQLLIYDYTGRTVSQEEIYYKKDINYQSNGKIKVSFDRKDLVQGIYFYRLCTFSNLTLGTGKLMIAN